MAKMTHKLSNERILCAEWNPQIENLIAVGSFDHNVYLVSLEEGKSSEATCEVTPLKYHSDRVRSLSWNHELPWILISAADD